MESESFDISDLLKQPLDLSFLTNRYHTPFVSPSVSEPITSDDFYVDSDSDHSSMDLVQAKRAKKKDCKTSEIVETIQQMPYVDVGSETDLLIRKLEQDILDLKVAIRAKQYSLKKLKKNKPW